MACRRLASGTADDSRCGLQLKNEWYEEDPQDNYVKGFKQCKKLFTSHFSPLMYFDVHCLCRSIAQEKNIPPFYTLLLYARIIRNVYRTKIHSASLLCSDSPWLQKPVAMASPICWLREGEVQVLWTTQSACPPGVTWQRGQPLQAWLATEIKHR